ncbi:MAG: MltA domain-containing protein [Alphaproteobacteria bacterium]|nr:MltA domain-containing protein [Alphaproteobacteria bacterium]
MSVRPSPMRRHIVSWPAGLALVGLLAACISPSDNKRANPTPSRPASAVKLRAVAFTDLPGWGADRQDRALVAFARSCPRLTGAWRGPCGALGRVARGNPIAARAFFELWFRAYALQNSSSGLFTGYYEPVLRGSLRRRPGYNVPLHAKPRNLARLRPYPARAQILKSPLRTRIPVLLWLADPVDAFTLHIQGSGLVRLAGGGTVRVGVAATNGRRYVSIGRVLLQSGALTRRQATMQGIRAWLRAHPREAAGVMNRNPRYIFFRIVRGPGPIGGQGVALTPGRSLAIDPRFIAYGTPVWLDTTWPSPPGGRLRRLVIAQDKGGAIKGAMRGDLFVGRGAQALTIAGRMRQRGRYFLLLPRARQVSDRRRRGNAMAR